MARISVVIADAAESWRFAASSFVAQSASMRVVGTAANGTEALHLVRKVQPDVILMDLNLPGLNPFEACKIFSREQITTKLVIVCLNSDAYLMNLAIGQGVSGYIHKTDFAPELAIALRIVMNGKHFVSSQICDSISKRIAHLTNSDMC